MTSDNTILDDDVRIRPARPTDFEQLHAFDIRVFGQLAYPYFVLRQLFDTLPNCWLVADHPLGLLHVAHVGVDQQVVRACDDSHRIRFLSTRPARSGVDQADGPSRPRALSRITSLISSSENACSSLTKSSGLASASPWGQSEPNSTLSVPMRSASLRMSSS